MGHSHDLTLPHHDVHLSIPLQYVAPELPMDMRGATHIESP
jgi:hypothetical protein